MKKLASWMGILLVVAACGGEAVDGEEETGLPGDNNGATASAAENETDSGSSSGGGVVNPPPPGQAAVSVDGNDYMFGIAGPAGCSISDSEINFGFIIGDNDVNVMGGGTHAGADWRGRVDLSVQETDGIANYFAELADGATAVEGDSMSYTGPWQLFPPGGSEAESVGDGTISVTCG